MLFPDNIFLEEKKHVDILLDFFSRKKKGEDWVIVFWQQNGTNKNEIPVSVSVSHPVGQLNQILFTKMV